ncbi:glutaredoxin family protein [Salinimonas sediminis]|uniref:Glutaredoxin family protein n=1 Tax=Salinimonas sediminis TaxID=2303538 RepID=A0A346NM22_9ALTE|nr:glutaredoxin family protein [Salinimonas sediminis]AXR06579.1 glutaredoxin family protein [Salinimonas sediminis]
MNIVLFGGPACTLCDNARTMLQQCPGQITIKSVNVRQDNALYHAYGARIPVIQRSDNHAELAWPFSQNELESFLQ